MAGSGTKADPYVATCSDNGKELTGSQGDSFYVTCPANCTTGSLWGTGPYTRDSSICTSAVHAGAIAASGGLVKASILAGQENYAAGDANGVSSHSWPSYDSSLGVEPGTAKVAAPAAPAVAPEPTKEELPSRPAVAPTGTRPLPRGGGRGH